MDKPFTPIVFSMIIGILISYYLNIAFIWIILFLVFFVLLFLYNIIRDRTNSISIFIVFMLLSMLSTNINKSSSLLSYIDNRYDYLGIVDEVIVANTKESKYVVIIKKVSESENIINEKIILKVIGNKELSLGETITLNGSLKLPMENTNPKLFNQKLNLLSDKIHTSMTIKDFSVNIIERDAKFKYKIKDKFSKDISNLFNQHLNEENSSLMSSIVLGKSSYLEEDELLKYRELGLAHILAVSGLHIGIISSFIIFLLSRLGVKRKTNIILTLATIWAYGYLIGFPPSTVRASLMFAILYYSQLIHEPYDSINTIMISILISLFINPFWLFNIGFQLSYVATLSILIFTPRIIHLFYPYRNKMILALSSILAVNIGLLPIQGYYFNRIPIIGIISNLITIPILSFALILGISMIMLNYIISFLNLGLGYILNIILNIESKLIDLLYEIPLNFIKVFSPDIIFCLLYFLALGIIFGIIKFEYYKKGFKKTIFYYLLLLVLINAINIYFDKSINVEFIDVGQGDAILIKTQGSNYLMDTGGSLLDGFDVGKYITVPYLEKMGINKLNGVIITHFDEDHCGGLNALIENIEIKSIFASYIPENNQLKSKIIDNKIPFILLKENDVIRLDENTNIRIIWPGYNVDLSTISDNNKSIVSLLSYKDTHILFTGDIEKEVENVIYDKIKGDIRILKVPHHGSNTSSTMEFINSIKAEHSIISVGRNNFYGHPHDNVIERLVACNSSIYRTDEMGLIRVSMSNKDMNITYYLDRTNKHIGVFDFFRMNYDKILFCLVYYYLSYKVIMEYIETEKEGVDIEL